VEKRKDGRMTCNMVNWREEECYKSTDDDSGVEDVPHVTTVRARMEDHTEVDHLSHQHHTTRHASMTLSDNIKLFESLSSLKLLIQTIDTSPAIRQLSVKLQISNIRPAICPCATNFSSKPRHTHTVDSTTSLVQLFSHLIQISKQTKM